MALARTYFGDSVLNMMTVGGVQQVALKVRIAEINRGAARELGISMSGSRTGNPTIVGGTGGNAGRPVRPPADVGSTLVAPATSGFGALDALISIGDRIFLNVAIDALEEKGFARLLAEPNLTALSGSEARFLAGGEVPVPEITDEGQIGVTFKQVGVSLNFVPTVLEDGLINVAVTAEVSDVDPTVGVTISPGLPPIPGFRVRRATTMVELDDGQSFAIAGLYENTFDDAVTQVPWLGDIPVIGTLFRSTNFNRGETELVIVVSVDRVGPAPRGVRLETPVDRVRLPTEAELFLVGRTEGGFDDVWSQIGADLEGPFGYVVE
jgi:pilus assembly protein CpaC